MGGKRKEKSKKPEKMSWAELTGPTLDIVKVPRDWNELVSDDEDVQYISFDRSNLPKAPRGAHEIPLDKVPSSPPYILYMSGIPFTFTTDQVSDFFKDANVLKVTMNSEDGRNRGTAVVEFGDRISLINGLKKDDCMMGTRPVRITLDNPRDKIPINRGGSDFGRGMSSAVMSSTDLPDNWRSAQRKTSDLPPPHPTRNESFSQMSGFSRFANRQLDASRTPYRGRHSEDLGRQGRNASAFGSTWSGAGTCGRFNQRERFNEQSFKQPISANENERGPSDDQRPATNTSNPVEDGQQPNEAVRTVNKNALLAMLSGSSSATSEATPRSQSIFGNAKPVDTSGKIAATMEKMQRLHMNTDSTDSRENGELPASSTNPTPANLWSHHRTDRQNYRSSRSEELRLSKGGSSSQPQMMPYGSGNSQQRPPQITSQQRDYRKTGFTKRTIQGSGPSDNTNRYQNHRSVGAAGPPHSGSLRHKPKQNVQNFQIDESELVGEEFLEWTSTNSVGYHAPADRSESPHMDTTTYKPSAMRNKFSSLMTDNNEDDLN